MKYEDEVGLWVTGSIFMILVILVTIASCFWQYHANVKEEPKKVEVPKNELKVLAYIGPFMKVEVDGHWCLVGVGCRSITHMPSCPCYNKDE